MTHNSQFKISILSNEKFDLLAKHTDFYCISIFIPFVAKDKNLIDKVKKLLWERLNSGSKITEGIDDNSIKERLSDIKSILVEWKRVDNQENIAIYLSNSLVEIFYVEKSIPFKVYLNDHFYLKFFAQDFNHVNSPFKEYIKDKKIEKILTEDINEIIKLSAKGKIKALLLEKGNDIFGELDEENDFIFPTKEEVNATSLSNIAAIHTILNKGNVFIVEKKNMPNPNKPINALKKN